jgi:glycerol kinase
VQWLRDGLGIIAGSGDVEALAAQVTSSEGIYFVPAFVGLGAPYWDSEARGAIVGLTRGSTRAHFARAAMQADAKVTLGSLRVDGGATVNNLLMQFQADLLGTNVLRPVVQETTALGAAYLAGLAVGYWTDFNHLTENWKLDREFRPSMPAAERDRLYAGWQSAIQMVRTPVATRDHPA